MPTALSRLPGLLGRTEDYHNLLDTLGQGKSPLALSGLAAVHRACLAAALREDTGRPLVLVCADEGEARKMAGDLAGFLGLDVPVLPGRDLQFHPGAASRQWEHQRLEVLAGLSRGEVPVLTASLEGLLLRTLPPEVLDAAVMDLSVGQTLDLSALTDRLTAAGYARCDQVEGTGQFALRGGILDVFTPGLDLPVRMEFWGDEIDSMGLFDPVTQRRTAQREQVTLLPAGEVLSPDGKALEDPRDLVLPKVYNQLVTAADYLPENALIGLCDLPRLMERSRAWLWQLNQDVTALLEEGLLKSGKKAVFGRSLEDLCEKQPSGRTLLYLDSFLSGSLPVGPGAIFSFNARQLAGYGVSFQALEEDLRQFRRENYAVVVLTADRRKADALQNMLREENIVTAVDEHLTALPEAGDIILAAGSLSAGFDFPDGKFAVLSEGSAPAPVRKRRASKAERTNRQRLESYTDLSPGDLVVHEHHGIGRFVGMTEMTVDGVRRDYIRIQFAGSDALYVPALQLDLVSKYIGGGEDNADRRLDRLGSGKWEKTKARAKKAAKDLAKGLIQLYAQRQRLAGHAFAPDSPWQQEFESLFPYPETEDQLRCVREIKEDMEKAVPMDRLLCGDVGYGKTEVAFRAAMKCILDGKQAAVLVPTTVLARQHYLTALKRFSHFPVTVEMVSRFRTPKETQDILRRTEAGEVDLLIGTHKLLGKDVRFKDLGLLVVDEEQRFGVTHKEKLKKMAHQVDVLTLSATPIPRTLNMALSGLRDMSTLEQPPANRQPVQTYVTEHDWGLLAEAIRRELDRGGQVYYLHNRTETIDRCAARLREILGPEVRIATAHGRMDEEQLSDIMSRMSDGELDVLVCTTIIETGIDLPNVNTLIIEDADRLGLAQLHQLRGRVGRSTRRASAYMTYRKNKILTEDQSKRLSAIREYAAFGSGFKIAMRDLEIRGAGNLLGPEQSGFVMSVGYDLYLRLLEEAVLEEQGQPVSRPTDCLVELPVPAALPDDYIPSPAQRMDLYRRIARVRNKEEADELLDELIDRYGDPPEGAANLLRIALLRARAARCGVTEITKKETLLFALAELDLQTVAMVCSLEKYRGRLLFSAGDRPHLALRLKKGETELLKLAETVVGDLEGQKTEEKPA